MAGIIGTPLSPSVRWMLAASKAGTGDSYGRDGVERIAAYVPLGQTPNGLFVAVGVAKKPAMADINRAAWQGGLTLALLFIIALIAALMGGRVFIEQPISSIAGVAQKWREGELTARADIAGQHAELSYLASVFNTMASTIQDREEALRGALQHQELLIRELNHRVKNSLAVVQALAQQSMRGPESKDDLVKAFVARLVAFAAAHDVLTEQAWEGADLSTILAKVVAPHCGIDGSRLKMQGPPIRLTAKQTLALAMGLHELCTNAVKYGALSIEHGQVRVEWWVKGEHKRLFLHWRESGGPKVKPPTHQGFGSWLIQEILAQDVGGTVEMDFAPSGVQCTIEVPLESEGAAGLPEASRREHVV
jgi:two-component sensor histidine kinase